MACNGFIPNFNFIGIIDTADTSKMDQYTILTYTIKRYFQVLTGIPAAPTY